MIQLNRLVPITLIKQDLGRNKWKICVQFTVTSVLFAYLNFYIILLEDLYHICTDSFQYFQVYLKTKTTSYLKNSLCFKENQYLFHYFVVLEKAVVI